MIALKNVSKSYGKHTILSDLSLCIDPATCVCIVGESGSGKTTLLQLLLRAEDPTSGVVEIDGVDIRTVPSPVLQLYRQRVGVIFQEPVLLEHATIAENIGLPLQLLGAPDALIERNTADLLGHIGLNAKATLFPSDLSLSECSLVCIARALISAPMVIIADDPVHNLDVQQKLIVKELFANMHKKGTTIIFASRDPIFGHSLHAQIIELKSGKTNQEGVATSSKMKAPETHRILEEEAKAPETAPPPSATQNPPPQESGGKRIRITSIGQNS